MLLKIKTNMGRHIFSFKYGDKLTTMGAAWFVSRSYYEYIHRNHKNWMNVSTHKNRNSVFKNLNLETHLFLLKQVEFMDVINLNKNTIGLKGDEVKDMALEIIDFIQQKLLK